MQTNLSSEQHMWLFSRRADFWLACGGASVPLLASMLVIAWHGDREIDALDFVLSEFHLGATYGAIIQRRLWRDRHVNIVLIPLVILGLTYTLSTAGQSVLLTSIAMYAAVWHRGRQSLGVARFYQRAGGGPVLRAHEILFRGAIYLPMLAAMFAYTYLAPREYEGDPYLALSLGAEMTSTLGVAAALWVFFYLAWSVWQGHREYRIHPGERWVVLAHAMVFGSGYVLGASNASFLLVLAVHHEVQYLYFAYAMSRRSNVLARAKESTTGGAPKGCCSTALSKNEEDVRFELKHAANFLLWPLIGFGGAVAGGWLAFEWLAPLGAGGLFCHYWLDGRIWTRRSLAA